MGGTGRSAHHRTDLADKLRDGSVLQSTEPLNQGDPASSVTEPAEPHDGCGTASLSTGSVKSIANTACPLEPSQGQAYATYEDEEWEIVRILKKRQIGKILKHILRDRSS